MIPILFHYKCSDAWQEIHDFRLKLLGSMTAVITAKFIRSKRSVSSPDLCTAAMLEDETGLEFKKPPAEGHRCGICPTYFQKLCAFNFYTNETFIFDNVCVMDLYNCIHGTEFIKLNYENCLYFGNFAYVHGLKHEDYDYGEDHISMTHSKKNPDFVR